jgi:hypothetical protein
MTRLTLDLTTKQINLLFESLETLQAHYKTTNATNVESEITDLIRYLDRKVFPEWENK